MTFLLGAYTTMSRPFPLRVAIIPILVMLFWLWMLIDCLASSMPPTEKLIWFLVIFFLPLLGSILYLILRRGRPPARY